MFSFVGAPDVLTNFGFVAKARPLQPTLPWHFLREDSELRSLKTRRVMSVESATE